MHVSRVHGVRNLSFFQICSFSSAQNDGGKWWPQPPDVDVDVISCRRWKPTRPVFPCPPGLISIVRHRQAPRVIMLSGCVPGWPKSRAVCVCVYVYDDNKIFFSCLWTLFGEVGGGVVTARPRENRNGAWEGCFDSLGRNLTENRGCCVWWSVRTWLCCEGGRCWWWWRWWCVEVPPIVCVLLFVRHSAAIHVYV